MDRPRPLTEDDLDAIDTLRPHDWPPYRRTFERYFALDCVRPWAFGGPDGLVAMGTLIDFGKTGWMAQVITSAQRRGQGWGSKMVRFLLDQAQGMGMHTVSLVATELGYPLYAAAGFRVEGEYAFWTRSTPAPALPEASEELKAWSESYGPRCLVLDRKASGEGRAPYLRHDWSQGYVVPGEGYFLPTVGEGLVVAKNRRAGEPLLHRRIDGASRVVVPLENSWAPVLLSSRGFALEKRMRRMVWGRSLRRRPEWVGSRIGGNLG